MKRRPLFHVFVAPAIAPVITPVITPALFVALMLAFSLPTQVGQAAVLQPALVEKTDSACDDTARIMPLGDSITQGISSGIVDTAYQVSYRKELWDSLKAAGYNVDFVGSLSNGQAYAGFDPHHEGHPGLRDDEVAAGVYGWLVKNPADLVLLHIGTNEVNPSSGDVETILKEIDRFSENIVVILARIINRATYSSLTTQFNDNVETMAQARIASGDKIVLVDMEEGAGLDYRLQPAGDMYNELHPFATGFSKMAKVWFDALDDIITACRKIFLSIINRSAMLSAGEAASAGASPFLLASWDTPLQGADAVGLQGQRLASYLEQNAAASPRPPAVYEVDTVDETPVSYWTLDETSRPYLDSVGDNDATCTDPYCPANVEGIAGNGKRFNGTDTQVIINNPAGIDFSLTDDFSISQWVKLDPGHLCTTNEVFVSRYSTNASWWVGCGKGNTEVGDKAIFSLRSKLGESYELVSTRPINDGEWHHVVAVRNGASQEVLLYVDGAQVKASPTFVDGHFSPAGPLTMGFHNALDFQYQYNGVLDEVAIYRKALVPSGPIYLPLISKSGGN